MLHTEPWFIAARRQSLAASRTLRKCKQTRNQFATAIASRTVHDDAPSASTSTSSATTRRQKTISTIRKAQDVLAKPLPRSSVALRTWISALHKIQQRLNEEDGVTENASVAITGLGNQEAARNLVSVLLDDPLSSDTQQYEGIRDRWKASNGKGTRPLHFRHSSAYLREADQVYSTSSFLQRLSVDIIEIPANSGNETDIEALMTADIPLIVIEPFADLSTLRNILPSSPHTILVINFTPGPASRTHVLDNLSTQLTGCIYHPVFVDIERALTSLDALRTDSSSAPAVQKYQDGFLASDIASLTAKLQNILDKNRSSLRESNAQSIARRALMHSKAHMTELSSYLHIATEEIEKLQTQVNREKDRTIKDILPSPDGPSSALLQAGKDLKATMDSLTWWKLPMSVDELHKTVTTAVELSSLRSLEQQLIFHAGRLSSLQVRLQDLTDAAVKRISPVFDSSVVRNTLAQLSTSPFFHISPTSLLEPLKRRLQQFSMSTQRLHLTAQKAVFGTIGTGLSSTAASYVGWTASYVDGSTAAGISALSTMIALRWAIRSWDKAKRDWLEDWHRMADVLKADQEECVKQQVKEHVMIVPDKACVEIGQLLETRIYGLEDTKDQVEGILAELDNINVTGQQT